MSGYLYNHSLPHETVALRNELSNDELSNLCFLGYDEMSVECGVAE